MKHRYQLAGLGNDELLTALSTLVKHDNALTADLLAHLGELDERRLFLRLGFPSLFAYCVEVLGFCESTAGRRIAAARVCRRFPEVLSGVADGEWSVSALCALRPHFTQENAAELLASSRRKSIRQVEELLATRFPRPDVRDSIRRLPARPAPLQITPGAGRGFPAGPTEEEPTVERDASAFGATQLTDAPLPSAPLPSAPRPIASVESSLLAGLPYSPRAASTRRMLAPLSPERFGVHFTADLEFRDLLERVRALASHRSPDGDLLSLMKAGLAAYRRELEKERFAVGRKPRAAPARGSSRGPRAAEYPRGDDSPADGCDLGHRPRRHIPAAVAREVYLRDERQCTFVSEDGRRCGGRRFLEFDHIEPHAVGGLEAPANLRLRCRAHNQQHAVDYFGATSVRAAVVHSKQQRLARVGRSVGPGSGSSRARAPAEQCPETGEPRNGLASGGEEAVGRRQ